METLDPFTCPVAELRRMAQSARIRYCVANGVLEIYPYRGPRQDIRAAIEARAEEVREHITASGCDPCDYDGGWDAVSRDVTGIPYVALEALIINSLKQCLEAAYLGKLFYLPPLPWWADDAWPGNPEGRYGRD